MFKLFNLFKKQPTFSSGAMFDDRSEEEKKKDTHFNEVVISAATVNWVEKPQSEWRKFPIFNQDGSGSCVAQTMAKIMGIMYWLNNNDYVHFSATHIYQRRKGKPNPGMIGVNAFEIAKEGATLEVLVPSQNMSDFQMDAVKIEKYKEDVGKIFKIGDPIILPIKDIDSVASVMQVTKKPIMLWFYFTMDEWNKDVPTINVQNLNPNTPGIGRHSVTGTEYTLYNGKKAIIIEDSWGTYGTFKGQRIITEDFFKERNFFAAYTMNFKFEEGDIQPDKPYHTFNVDLEYGQKNDEIVFLQDILKYEGLFPKNIESTGYFGSVTTTAVQEFQIKYKISGKNLPGFGRVGPKTRVKLNELYGE